MHRERHFRETSKHFLDQAIRAGRTLASRRYGALLAFERLLRQVQQHSDLLRPHRRCGDLPANGRCRLIAGLLALALHHEEWLHPVESWTPPTTSSWRQFAVLAQHLLAAYPMPHFMASAWLEMPGRRCVHQEWYKQMGRGLSIRKLNLPITCTKAMAHCFAQAPDHYPVSAALRWAQVRGLGGNERLARAVIATRLGSEFEHEEFWLGVLHFFVNHPRLDLVHVGPIVDFIHHQRFATSEVIRGGQLVTLPPEQPDYSLKGRTVASLLRHVAEWHDQLGRVALDNGRRWSPSRINDFELLEGSEQLHNLRRWTITELLSSGELVAEGQAMKHCVATYVPRCVSREVSIWSMKVETDHGQKPVLTIEVDLAKKVICQARRRSNAMPKEKERQIMQEWARRERLSIVATL